MQLILVGGALLAAGLAASLFAARFRVPALVLVLIAGMADRLGRDRLDRVQRLRGGPPIGIVALALILFEGGLAAGWSEIRPVLRPSVSLAVVGTILTALLTGFVASWVFDLSTLEGLLVGLDHRRHRRGRRSSRCCGPRPCGAGWRRRWRGSRASTTRWPCCWCWGSSTGSRSPDYGILDMVGFFAQQLSIGLAVGLAGGLRRGGAVEALAAGERGPVPGGDAGDRGDRLRRGRRAARLGLPRGLPGGARARQPRDPGAPHGGRRSTRGLPGSPRSRCSSRSACSCSRRTWWTWR